MDGQDKFFPIITKAYTITVETIPYPREQIYRENEIQLSATIRETLVISSFLNGQPYPGQLNREVIMREKTIERKLMQAVKAQGGLAPKFVSPGFDGMPDRIVLMPDGKIGFVEVKRHGEKPRPLQESRHGMLRRLGFQVFVLDDEGQIGGIIRELQST